MAKNNDTPQREFKFAHIQEYPGSPRAHKNLFVYEKIDGGNCSVRKEEGIPRPYSRSRKLTSQDLGNFYFRRFHDWVYSTQELQAVPENMILCGEWTHSGVGHINYNPEYMNRFFLLAVFDKETGKYIPPAKTERIVNSASLNDKIIRLPILQQGDINQEIADRLVEGTSSFYNGPKEGIVIHKYDPSFKNGLRMEKYFSPGFREIDYTKKGIERLVTKRRIIKAIQNLKPYRKNLSFENIVSAAVNDILRYSKEYKEEELIGAFHKPEVKKLFLEDIAPLFKKDK